MRVEYEGTYSHFLHLKKGKRKMEFERRNAMTLEEFLRKIDHKNYSVFYQDANLPVEMQKPRCLYEPALNAMTALTQYLDCKVLFISEDWKITISGEKIIN